VIGAVVALLGPAASLVATVQPPPRTLRYDLETGDRLVYRQTLTREAESGGSTLVARAEWTSEVLVLAANSRGAVVGMQRRRRSAELVRGRGNDARGFVERLARRPEVVAAANVFDDRGQALLALSVEREWPSDLLPFVQEIEALPVEAVAPGQRFHGTHPLGLEFRAEEGEDVAGEPSFRLRGTLPRGQVVLDLWFGIESRILRRLELEGSYPIFGGEIREKLRLDILEHHRGERPDDWLSAPERRQAVLAAMLITDGLPVEQARLEALLAVEDPIVQRAALRLLWQRRLPVAASAVAPLVESGDPHVRALATLALHRAPSPEARPILELSLSSVTAAVRGGGTVARWRCEADASWPQRALDEQRLPAELPGARMRAMSSERWRGHPYVLLVPDEYRGDEPAPLLVYLSGGLGRALVGWSTTAEAVSRTGYLVAFPQASGMWWTDDSEELVRLLVDEILDRYNVDTNRVYLAGSSNGGTGTYFYAARWADRLAAAVSLEGRVPTWDSAYHCPHREGWERYPFSSSTATATTRSPWTTPAGRWMS
jgi:HEAT repeats